MKKISKIVFCAFAIFMIVWMAPKFVVKAADPMLVENTPIDYELELGKKTFVNYEKNENRELFLRFKVPEDGTYIMSTNYSKKEITDFQKFKQNGNKYEGYVNNWGYININGYSRIYEKISLKKGDVLLIRAQHTQVSGEEDFVMINFAVPITKVNYVKTKTIMQGVSNNGGILVGVTYKNGKTEEILISPSSFISGREAYYDDEEGNYIYVIFEDYDIVRNFKKSIPGTYEFNVVVSNYSLEEPDIFDSSKEGKSYKIDIVSPESKLSSIASFASWEVLNLKKSDAYSIFKKFTASESGMYVLKLNTEIGIVDTVFATIYTYNEDEKKFEELDLVSATKETSQGALQLEAGTYYIEFEIPKDVSVQFGYAMEYKPVTSISCQKQVSLESGASFNLYKTVNYGPANASNSYMAFASSNTKVATVSPRGQITAVAYGTAKITVKMDDVVATCLVSVSPEKKDTVFKQGNLTYKITKTTPAAATVSVVKADKKAKSIVIPENVTYANITYKVTAVEASILKGSKKLQKLVIGAHVKKIGKKAFYKCKKLKSVVIKSKKLTAKSVGSGAFSGINSKAKIKVPKSKLKAYKKLLKARGIKSKSQKVTK